MWKGKIEKNRGRTQSGKTYGNYRMRVCARYALTRLPALKYNLLYGSGSLTILCVLNNGDTDAIKRRLSAGPAGRPVDLHKTIGSLQRRKDGRSICSFVIHDLSCARTMSNFFRQPNGTLVDSRRGNMSDGKRHGDAILSNNRRIWVKIACNRRVSLSLSRVYVCRWIGVCEYVLRTTTNYSKFTLDFSRNKGAAGEIMLAVHARVLRAIL